MKKNFLYAVMALFVCLFTACSQEEIVSENGQGSNKVNLSVKVPGVGPVGRAATDLTVEGYLMRCIMELVDKNGTLIADSRKVVAVTNGIANFEFTKPAETYTCLFWADYVKNSITETTEVIYNAESLTNIGYKANKTNNLFNNKAADAFCGKLTSDAISNGTNVTLKRPFARIAVSKEDLANLSTNLNQFTASINGAKGFNIFSGTTNDAVTLSNTSIDNVQSPITIPVDGDLAFYCFVFPANGNVTKNSTITFTKNGEEDSKKTLSITSEQMKEMGTNTSVSLKPGTDPTPGDETINVKIEVDNSFDNGGNTPDPTPSESVKVGDYLYADGTWGTETTNAVAVVFAVGKNENDNSTYSLSKVNGYAVALQDAGQAKWADDAWSYDAKENPLTIDDTKEKYNQTGGNNWDGYKNCHYSENVVGKVFNTYAPIAAALYYDVVLTGNTSGWYLPTISQLEAIRSVIDTITPKLAAAGGSAFESSNYWSCVMATSGKAFRATFDKSNGEYSNTNRASSVNATLNIRPIVTF